MARWKYDERGNLVETRLYGTDEQLKEDKDGLAMVRLKYDERGNPVEQRYYGTDERLKENKYGVAIYRREVEFLGKLKKEVHFDKNGEVIK